MCGTCSIETSKEENLLLIDPERGTAVRASPIETGKRRRLGASTEQGNLIYALESVRTSTSEGKRPHQTSLAGLFLKRDWLVYP
mmetsp:Transcript_6841/g.41730  ORF Transcript_6841/g.41730 Transcript_6841/m.41730 type:complete len:84 (-) Transcript_6841:3620-3871(-)